MYSVAVHKPVFALYSGLIASGYDLVHPDPEDPLAALVNDIRRNQWSQEAIDYFAASRLDGPGVNPYWPRAAMLLNATFYVDATQGAWEPQVGDGDGVSGLDAVVRNVREFPIEASKKGQETIQWVMRYPAALHSILTDPGFTLLWDRFCIVMDDQRLAPFKTAARRSVDCLVSMLGISERDLPDLVVVPNPLQAAPIADFVRKSGKIYAVIATPRLSSVVHEMLHTVFEKTIQDRREFVIAHKHLFTPVVVDKMVLMQYAWGDDDASWLRVFEETLVRAASDFVCGEAGLIDMEDAIQGDVEQGFVYVPSLVRAFQSRWDGPDSVVEFMEACLEGLTPWTGDSASE